MAEYLASVHHQVPGLVRPAQPRRPRTGYLRACPARGCGSTGCPCPPPRCRQRHAGTPRLHHRRTARRCRGPASSGCGNKPRCRSPARRAPGPSRSGCRLSTIRRQSRRTRRTGRSRSPCHAQRRLDAQCRRRERLIGRAGRQQDRVHIGGRRAGLRQGLPSGGNPHERRSLMRGGEMPLTDPGTLLDPRIGGIDRARQLVIGDDPFGQVAAGAGRMAPGDRTVAEASAPGRSVRAAEELPTRARPSRIRSLNRCVTMSIATSTACAKPSASVPPCDFTTTPFSPSITAPL